MKLCTLIFLASSFCLRAQNYDTNGAYVQTFAGSEFYGLLDGQGQQTMFNDPSAIVADSSNNLFVLDNNNHRIRKITPDGTVSTFAGGGVGGLTGYGTNVSLGNLFPYPLAIDHLNALRFVEYIYSGGFTIARASADSYVIITNISQSYTVGGMCSDSRNNIYFSDRQGNKVYLYDTNGLLSVFVGSGNSGAIDGNGVFTSFNLPESIACDAADNLYIWDFGNSLIRRIDQSRNVTTFSGTFHSATSMDGIGTNAAFSNIGQMCFDNAGNLLLACGTCIRKISPSTNVTTIAGSFSQIGYTNGLGNLARFNGANGVCFANGTIYVADSSNQRIRSITNNPQFQIVSPANLQLDAFAGLTITGTVGRSYQIQSSSDNQNWTTCSTILLNESPHVWFDQNPIAGSKFYQAIMLP